MTGEGFKERELNGSWWDSPYLDGSSAADRSSAERHQEEKQEDEAEGGLADNSG